MRVSFFIFFFVIFFQVLGKAEETTLIYSLDENWLIYNENYESYIPVEKESYNNYKSLHSIVQAEKFREYNLSFEATKGLILLVNHKIVFKKKEGKKEKISLALKEFLNQLEGEVVLTFYHPDGKLPVNSARIEGIVKMEVLNKDKKQQEVFKAYERQEAGLRSYYVLIFIAIFFMLSVYKNYNNQGFNQFFSFQYPEYKANPILFKAEFAWLPTTFISGISLALLVYMTGLNQSLGLGDSFIFTGILIVLGWYLLYVFCKYIYISVLAWFFNYSTMSFVQFKENIRFSERLIFVAMIAVFVWIVWRPDAGSVSEYFLYFSLIVILILSAIRGILLFFRIITHRSLFLFSYLCATEILPLVIAVKILLF